MFCGRILNDCFKIGVGCLKVYKNFTFYILLALIFILALTMLTSGMQAGKIDYSKFIEYLEANNVKSVVLKEGTAKVELKEAVNNIKRYEFLYATDEQMLDTLSDYAEKQKADGISQADLLVYNIDRTPDFVSIILQLLPFILLIGGFLIIWFLVMNQSQNGANKAMNFGKSRAKLATESKQKVTFNDVAGALEEKQELEEIVSFLKDPGKYSALGARIPKGVLLVGPPGTGKTLLAKAVAGEAGVPFFSISGSDFVEMYVGVGASRVRDLFGQAKKSAPCIIFIDEIDAVGRHRGAGLGGGHDEREQTLNQLLVEMDGFQVNDGVIVMAATNRQDILDPALMRPGRFDRQIYVALPDVRAREEILNVHARNKPLSDEVSLSDIAKTTPGFSGADLENLLNESALIAARKGKRRIDMEDVKEATFKVIMGPEKKSRVMNDKEKRLTAYHEAGHALAVRFASTTDKVDRISIIPAGRAGGYTAHKPEEDLSYSTREQLFEDIVISLAGKAAEELVLGDCSTGATSDLTRANKVARNMVTKLGMSPVVGNLVIGSEHDEVFLGKDYGHTKGVSEELSATVDREVKKIIDECDDKARVLLKEHMKILNRLADELLVKEKIEGDEFERIVNEELGISEEAPAIAEDNAEDNNNI